MLTRCGYLKTKDSLSNVENKNLREELTVQPISESNFIVGEPFKVYRESLTQFRLPKFWAIERFGKDYIDKSLNGVPISLEFNGTLNESTRQPEAVEKSLKCLQKTGGGILCLPPGYGKTTVSLYLLSQLKTKTLVIVHKEFLMTQWKERIAQFLPSASVGCIQQNKFDVQGRHIVMGMLQSLSSKSYDPKMFDSFGLVIIDETHHICSRVFSKALFNLCPKYILGLSATPQRKDGLTKVLNWFIGPIIFKVKRENQDGVFVVYYVYKDPYFTNENIPMSVIGKVNFSKIVNILCEIKERNELIVAIVSQLLNEQRKIIILSDRRSHCEELCEMTHGNGAECSLYMGGMSQAELTLSEKADVIFATYSMAQEGLDIPKLDTLIMATPKTDIVQASGRIMRETPGKKNNPLIVDICDFWQPLHSKGPKRRSYYKKSGFKVSSTSSLPLNLEHKQFTKLQDSKPKQTKSYCFVNDEES